MTIAASLSVARSQPNLAPLCVAAASFLLLVVNGAGRYSLDARRAK